jgi:hypothetical protein
MAADEMADKIIMAINVRFICLSPARLVLIEFWRAVAFACRSPSRKVSSPEAVT